MSKLVIRSVDDFRAREGQLLFRSPPRTVSTANIQNYCRSIGQTDWFHFDAERAAREFGGIVAPGTMTLALIHSTYFEQVELHNLKALFVGSDRFRVIAPLIADSAISLEFTVKSVEERKAGFRVQYDFLWTVNEAPLSTGNMIVRYQPVEKPATTR